MHTRRTMKLLKKPRHGPKYRSHSSTGFSCVARTLVVSRRALQAAIRRSRMPAQKVTPVHRTRPMVVNSDLPERLVKPEMEEVTLDAIHEVAWEFNTHGYRFSLETIRSAMGAGADPHLTAPVAQTMYAEPPSAILPKHLDVIMEEGALTTLPSHYLAIYPSIHSASSDPATRVRSNPGRVRDVQIWPGHASILVIYCTRLPSIPKSEPRYELVAGCNPEAPLTVVTLPVWHIPIPRTKQFALMMQYFYSYDWRQLAFNLIPMLPTPDLRDTDPVPQDLNAPSMHVWTIRHALRLTYVLTPQKVVELKDHVLGVYQNMLALGIADRKMWQVVCFSYDALRLVEDLRENKELLARLAPLPDPSRGVLQWRNGWLRFYPYAVARS
ncbi:hypothetical protein BXZ70DRAFT_55015 [Cristinia sonorae]|uniref:Uncharacterized protein n=1 Tax=Cristinia sonorae TaxID=1940300 RepID=A0A8K0XR94_9AGAR|nr:hypothetical protein BXZ70DRAFT_55015 [Cristinia sonorae]